jgi:predicted exporter
MSSLLADLYLFFSQRRLVVFFATLVAIVVSVIAFANLNLSENIESMLPDNKSDAALNFRLLQQTPFSRKVVINLKEESHGTENDLIEVVDRLAAAMTRPFFTHVVSGTKASLNLDFLLWLINAYPNLFTETDIDEFQNKLTPVNVRQKLKELYATLLSPEGSVMKGLFQVDPLDFRLDALKKLRFLNIIPRMRIENGHFISADGNNALILAETPFEITDAKHSREMLAHFQDLLADIVPDNISASMISGHRYTLANIDAIKKDIATILICSSVGIFILFLLFLRSLAGVFVFLIPLCALCIAAAGVSVFYRTVSAVTIGFGAVLLGISADFAIHVYFALRSNPGNPTEALARVSGPIIFCALTTLGAFGVLSFSNLPVQRELAVFAIIGVCAALIFSLIILPHVPGFPKFYQKKEKTGIKTEFQTARKWVIFSWLAIMITCAWLGTKLRFDGDLRALNLVPDEIRKVEDTLQQTWGNFRGTAVVFAEGADLQTALEINDRIFKYLVHKNSADSIVSLAPILPSLKTQQSNRQRWNAFWSNAKKAAINHLLASEGKSIGFKSTAFDPFFRIIAESTPPITAEDLKKVGLAEIVDTLIVRTGKKVKVLTLIPDTPEIASDLDHIGLDRSSIQLASQNQFRQMISKAIADDFINFILRASGVVIFLLVLFFRNLIKVLLALIPVVSGMLLMVGVMSILGIGFNLFNIVAAILIIGLGVDYGIFMVTKISSGLDLATQQAVTLSGLTTLAGFGALIVARHPALHSIGLSVLVGISAAIPAALLVIPAMYHKNKKTASTLENYFNE